MLKGDDFISGGERCGRPQSRFRRWAFVKSRVRPKFRVQTLLIRQKFKKDDIHGFILLEPKADTGVTLLL